jgi:hypothetical protein
MGILKMVLKNLKVVTNVVGVAPVFTTGAVDLGNIKGKPFLKVTWDQEVVASQNGDQPLGLTAKMETSTLDIDAAAMTALKPLFGTNVSLQATPQGTVSATNPILIVKDFTLLRSGEIDVGDASSLKLHGNKPAADEDEIYALVTAGS